VNQKLLKGKDVAEELNVSLSQAFALMRSGYIPTVRFGDRCIRVRPTNRETVLQRNVTGQDLAYLRHVDPSNNHSHAKSKFWHRPFY
jgi:hypothetical protein